LKINTLKQLYQAITTDFDSIHEVKDRLLNFVLVVNACLLLLSAAGMVGQIMNTGFFTAYIFFFTFIGCIIALALFRNRLPYRFKVYSMLVAFHGMGFVVVWYMGLFGAMILLLEALIFSAIFIGARAGLLSTLLTLATLAFIGTFVTSGWHTLLFDFNAMNVAPGVWISRAINVAATFMLLGLIVDLMIKALSNSERKYHEIFDATTDAIFIHDMETGSIVSVNQGMLEMFGYTLEEAKSLHLADLSAGASPYSQEEAMGWMKRAIDEGPQRFEWLSKRKDGELFWTEVSLKHTHIGEEEMVLASVRDISQSKAAENELRRSLDEKDVLLREIHHRVKSNLQSITGLLSLQAIHNSDDTVVKALKDSRLRIRTMALIHETLYQAEDLTSIDMRHFVSRLVSNLAISYGADPDRITLKVEVEDVNINVDTAIPVGLIINELVSNALIHAFQPQGKGQVRISFDTVGESRFRLAVADNGAGFPERVDILKSDSLGMQLVSSLSEQLGSAIELSSDKGASFQLEFDEYYEAGSELH
jgi:PAS domain S-box-containing protein